jgi:tRNA modification GTPase
MTATDTIAAIATAQGHSALGVLRVSGHAVPSILQTLLGSTPPPRQAVYRLLRSMDGEALDAAIVLYFPAPASFTGEHVCEFHTHGNPLVMQNFLQELCRTGARLARPGEFSERAYRNGKLDLAQAEAVADLIESRSLRAARSALRTLRGEFSSRINALVDSLTRCRVAFEGAIDFPDDISEDFLAVTEFPRISDLRLQIRILLNSAQQGARLNSGATVAIVGAPNVGKSTLLNRLSGADKAIVSAIPGTTRDVIEVDTLICDVPVRLCDTAGLRDTEDPIEEEGIRRANAVMTTADLVVLMTDDLALRSAEDLFASLGQPLPAAASILVVHNKIDAYGERPRLEHVNHLDHLFISARDGSGMEILTQTLGTMLGLEASDENEFVARSRHLAALELANAELAPLDATLARTAPELTAEGLRRAADALHTIVGGGGSEALLGEIFSRFCIGK